MGPYELERIEAMLISLRDQVDTLSERVDTVRESYTEQFGRIEALVLALTPPRSARGTAPQPCPAFLPRAPGLVSEEPQAGGSPTRPTPALSLPVPVPEPVPVPVPVLALAPWAGSRKARR